MTTPRAPDADHPRWPRRRRVRDRHDPARWDQQRTSEDVPSLAGTIGLTALGTLPFAVLWWLQPIAATVVYAALLLWSVAIDLTGNRVTTRVRGPVAIVLWALVRPFYAVGVGIAGLLELFGAFLG